MKQRTRITHAVSRALLATVIFAIIVCISVLTASAANTLSETSMTYDFTAYTSSNDAIRDGWSISGDLPYGATGSSVISASGGYVGVLDRTTREGYGLYENLEVVYTIPASDRICLADYDAIRFTRALNAANFLVSGAEYAVILTLDTGDTIRVEQQWFDIGVTDNLCEIEVELQEEFEALPADASLVSISFMPYVNADEFRPDTACENELVVQFFVGYIAFEKAVDMPVVSTVADTYDGLTVLEHNGAITGLNPEYTYEYKLTYGADWTRVNKASEISGLTGAAYVIRRVADETSGLRASEALVVSVPKTLTGGVEYSVERVSAGNFLSVNTTTPTIGTWVSGARDPYKAAGALTISTNFGMMVGTTPYAPEYSALEGAFYRRNVLKFDYAFTAEEQIEFSKSSLGFALSCNGAFPYPSYQDVSAIVKIYVAGYEDPVILRDLRFASGSNKYIFNLPVKFPDIKGYIERIEYYPFYNQDVLASFTSNYPQISNFYVSEIYQAPKPSLFAVDIEDGTYKICGFKSSVQYEISYDEGATWELLPERINFLEGMTEGTYYIRQVGDFQYLDGEPQILVIKSRGEGPTDLSVSGTSITGLDPAEIYEYAPYSLANDMEYIQVTGVSSIDSLTPGIWSVRFGEGNGNVCSNPSFVFIEGSSTKGQVNIMAQEKNSAVRGFVTGEVSSDVRAICFYDSEEPIEPTPSLVMWQSWPKTTDMSVNETLNVLYAFEHHQAFDIKELYRFPYKAGFQGSGFYLNNGSFSGFYNKIRIYVVNSDVKYYEVFAPWTSSSKINFNIGAALPADAHGYVVGYEFFYYGMCPEISGTMKAGSPYPLWTIYDLVLGTKVPSPELSVRYNSTGDFTISGLDASYAHGYSSDGETFMELSKGVTSFNVKTPGEYYVYAQNSNGNKSELAIVEVQMDASTVAGLSVSGNSIEGLNENLVYEYRKYSLTSPEEFTVVQQGQTSINNLTAGLWEVRYVTATNDSKSSYYLVYGEKNGTIAFAGLYVAGGDEWQGEKGYVSGRWTSSSNLCYMNSVESNDTLILATRWNSSLEQKDLDAMYYSYQFTDDEIVPVSDVLPFKYYVKFGTPFPYSNPSTTRVRFHVAGGEQDYYDVLIPNSIAGAVETCDLLATHPDADGYVVAIQIWPYASFPNGTTLESTENRFPIIKIYGDDTGSEDPRLMSRINIAKNTPRGINLERVNANLYQLYKFTGFDATKVYEYSIDDGNNWVTLAGGTTELGPVVGGKYLFRFAATGNTAASDPCSVITPAMTPAFITGDVSAYSNIKSASLVEGMWTSYPSLMDAKNTAPTCYVKSDALNTVRYAYTFLPEHQFTVNEYPIFSLDFNNDMHNMGVSYLSDAIVAIDIYFVGSDEPYTVTTQWLGTNQTDGVSPNKFTLDLLELDSELGTKTVSAFVIRPYSNISKTPSQYNTSSSEDRYLYFRMFNAGFYSTVENVAAITSATHSEVNKFTGITLENVPASATVGTVIDADSINIVARYSDGTTKIVGNTTAELIVPELDKAGIYKVVANYRGAATEKTVTVGFDASTIHINSLPNKTFYYVGQMFNPEGLSFKYTTAEGKIVVDSTNYTFETLIFETAGNFSMPVEFCGQTYEIDVSVIPESCALTLNSSTDWTFDDSAKKLYGIEENTTVADVIAAFGCDIVVFDRTGVDITADTEALVGTGYTVATMYNGEKADYAVIVIMGDVNGNGRIDTNDYVLIKRAYLNVFVISKDSDVFRAADVNGNGNIDTNDYLQIKNHYRGTVNLFD